MADNFLERRFEDYRAGKLKPRLKSPAPKKAVFIAAPKADETLRQAIGQQRRAGHAVSFWAQDPAGAQAMAYATAAMYHPFDSLDKAFADARSRRAPMPVDFISLFD